MKKAILCLLFSWLFVICASATHYEITESSRTEYLALHTGDSLYMTAGEIGTLGMAGDSTAIIEGTSPWPPLDCDGCGMICFGCFYIDQIVMADMSSLAMSGGQVEKLIINDTATAVLDQSSYKITHVAQIDIKGNGSLSMSGGYVERIDIGGIEGGVIIIGPDPTIFNSNPIGIDYDGSGSGVIAITPNPITVNPDLIVIDSGGSIVVDPNGIINPPVIDPFASPSVVLNGGRIDEICSHRSSAAVSIEPSITLECLYYEYDESTRMLSGCWLDGKEFNIELIESQWSHNPTINDIQFIGADVRDIYINGGTHIFDDATFEYDRVYLGIEGPSEPPLPYAANYSSGTPAYVALIDDGRVGWLSAYNNSSIEITGGEIVHHLLLDDSFATVFGGSVGGNLIGENNAIVHMAGGNVEGTLEVAQNGTINLYGTDFEVTDLNGVTAALSERDKLSDFGTLVSDPGNSPYYTGTITGTLAYGETLNNTFKIEKNDLSDPLFGDIRIRRVMGARATVISFSQDDTGLLLKNNSEMTVITGTNPIIAEMIIVNSLADNAFLVQGNASISANFINIAGGMTVRGSLDHPEEMGFNEYLGTEDIPSLDEPEYADLTDLCPVDLNSGKILPFVVTDGQWTLEPGYYSAGIIIEDAAVSCLPGIYHLGGGDKANSGLILKGAAVVDANEVLFHLVEGGQVSIGNDAVLTASGSKSGYYQGFLFFQSLDNTNPAIFKGFTDCVGTLYFPANHVEVAGEVLCSTLMADTIELSTNAVLTVDPGR